MSSEGTPRASRPHLDFLLLKSTDQLRNNPHFTQPAMTKYPWNFAAFSSTINVATVTNYGLGNS